MCKTHFRTQTSPPSLPQHNRRHGAAVIDPNSPASESLCENIPSPYDRNGVATVRERFQCSQSNVPTAPPVMAGVNVGLSHTLLPAGVRAGGLPGRKSGDEKKGGMVECRRIGPKRTKIARCHPTGRRTAHFSWALVPLVQFPAIRRKNLVAIEATCRILQGVRKPKWKCL